MARAIVRGEVWDPLRVLHGYDICETEEKALHVVIQNFLERTKWSLAEYLVDATHREILRQELSLAGYHWRPRASSAPPPSGHY